MDRDRRKEIKERMLHYGRGSSLLESVYLFSRQEKSYWWTHSTMRWIPLKSILLMSQLVQNHHLFNYLLHFYLRFHLWFFYLLHADALLYFLGQGKAESCLFSLSYIKLTVTKMLLLSRETYLKGFCKIGISPPTCDQGPVLAVYVVGSIWGAWLHGNRYYRTRQRVTLAAPWGCTSKMLNANMLTMTMLTWWCSPS